MMLQLCWSSCLELTTDTNRFKQLLKSHLFDIAFWHFVSAPGQFVSRALQVRICICIWMLCVQRSGRHTCVTFVSLTSLRRPTTIICTSCSWTSWRETRGSVTGSLTGLRNNWSDCRDIYLIVIPLLSTLHKQLHLFMCLCSFVSWKAGCLKNVIGWI